MRILQAGSRFGCWYLFSFDEAELIFTTDLFYFKRDILDLFGIAKIRNYLLMQSAFF